MVKVIGVVFGIVVEMVIDEVVGVVVGLVAFTVTVGLIVCVFEVVIGIDKMQSNVISHLTSHRDLQVPSG